MLNDEVILKNQISPLDYRFLTPGGEASRSSTTQHTGEDNNFFQDDVATTVAAWDHPARYVVGTTV